MNADDPRHGTNAGYQKHRKDGEVACGPCRTAKANFQREYRQDPAARMRDRLTSKAGCRASWRLVAEHRADYERFYAEELAALRRLPESTA